MEARIYRISLVIFFMLLLILMASCDGSGRSNVTSDDAKTSFNSKLEKLNVNTNLADYPTDSEGNPLTGNPLGKEITTINPIMEIYPMGFRINGESDQIMEYSILDGLVKISQTPDLKWENIEYKNSIGADINGNGFDEIVNVYYKKLPQELWMTVIYNPIIDGSLTNDYRTTDMLIAKTSSVSTPYQAPYKSTTPRYWPGYPSRHDQPSLAKGDLNGDGFEEIVVGFGDTVYVIKTWDYKNSNGIDVITKKGYDINRLFVAVGDLDGRDGKDEIIVTHRGKVDILMLGHDTLQPRFGNSWVNRELKNYMHDPLLSVTYYLDVYVAVADFHGGEDPRKQLVFHGLGDLRWMGTSYITHVMSAMQINEIEDDFEWLDFWLASSGKDMENFLPTFTVLDWTGNGKTDEIFVSNKLFKYEKGANVSDQLHSGHDIRLISKAEDGVDGIDTLRYAADTAIAGDITGDGRDNLVLTYWEPHGTNNEGIPRLQVWGMNDYTGAEKIYSEGAPVVSIDKLGWQKVSLANTDSDSTIVRYTGEHELLFSDPKIIAVLAAPPYYKGVNENGATTRFGKRETQSESNAFSTGVSVGMSVGVSVRGSFIVDTQSGFSAKVKRTAHFDHSWTGSKSTSTYSIFGSGSEDLVIFTSVPFDVFYYEIISSDDPDVVPGEIMTISLPRKPELLSVSRDFYNANNGDFLPIDNRVLGHVTGNPWSYPSAIPSGLEWCLRSDDFIHVGEGYGDITTGVSKTEGIGEGSAAKMEVTAEAEVQLGGVTAGIHGGYRYGFQYEIENIEETWYEGVVPSISQGYAGSGYRFMLYVSPYSVGGQKFVVVNYAVK